MEYLRVIIDKLKTICKLKHLDLLFFSKCASVMWSDIIISTEIDIKNHRIDIPKVTLADCQQAVVGDMYRHRLLIMSPTNRGQASSLRTLSHFCQSHFWNAL